MSIACVRVGRYSDCFKYPYAGEPFGAASACELSPHVAGSMRVVSELLTLLELWRVRLQADAGAGAQNGAHGRGPRLYVGGVPDEITEEDIVEHFNKWGQVVDCYFPGGRFADAWQAGCMDPKHSKLIRCNLAGILLLDYFQGLISCIFGMPESPASVLVIISD